MSSASIQHPHVEWRRSRFLLLLVLPIIARVLLFMYCLCFEKYSIYSWDSFRFLSEAESLARGDGFQRFGVPETSLPPGYPTFLAALMILTPSHSLILFLQLVFSTLSCFLVYFAIRRYSERLAVVSLFGMALCPWTGMLSQLIMSETLGIFVASLLVFLVAFVSHGDRSNRNTGVFFAIGVCAAALPLICPGTLALSLGMFAAVLWRQRSTWPKCVLMGFGFVLTMLPWQLYCYAVNGRVYPAVVRVSSLNNGKRTWWRSWVTRDIDFHLPWDSLPAQAFDSDGERSHVFAVAGAATSAVKAETLDEMTSKFLLSRGMGNSAAAQASPANRVPYVPRLGRAPDDRLDAILGEIGARRASEHPWSYYLKYPFIRAVNLWLRMGRFSIGGTFDDHMRRATEVFPARYFGNVVSVGVGKATQRALIGLLGIVLVALYALYGLWFMYLALRALRSNSLLVWAICLGVLAYTLSSVYLPDINLRRNTVFYPALFFLSAFVRHRSLPFPLVKLHWGANRCGSCV